MRRIGIAAVLTLWLIITGCGSGMHEGSFSGVRLLSGNYATSLTTSTGLPMFNFNFTLNESGGNVSGTNMNFPVENQCFGPGTVVNGSVSTDTATQITKIELKMSYTPPSVQGQNQLDLKGTVTPTTISGTWNMTGVIAGCNNSGSFTMMRH